MGSHSHDVAETVYADEPSGPQGLAKYRGVLGWVAVVVGIVGLALACLPDTVIIGWLLLPIAFLAGIVGLSLSFKGGGATTAETILPRATGIAAMIISVTGVVVGVNTFFGAVSGAFHSVFDKSGHSRSAAISGVINDHRGDGQPAPETGETGDTGDDPSGSGSKEHPLRIGSALTNKEWQVILGTPREAGHEIAAENQFNDPPEHGMQYWIVPVTATYRGKDTANPGFDITVTFVAKNDRTYDDPCGAIPHPLNALDDVEKDDVAKGNTCVAVPAGAQGLWAVSAGFDAPPVYFAMK